MQSGPLRESATNTRASNDPGTAFSLADMLLGLGESQEIDQSPRRRTHGPQVRFTQPISKKAGRPRLRGLLLTFAEGMEGLTQNPATRAPAHRQSDQSSSTAAPAERMKSPQKKLAKAVEMKLRTGRPPARRNQRKCLKYGNVTASSLGDLTSRTLI